MIQQPPKEPTPEWLIRARAEGRAEALEMLKSYEPERFIDGRVGDQAVEVSIDCDLHWMPARLAEVLRVSDPAHSYIENLENFSADQTQEIWLLKDGQTNFNDAINFALDKAGPEGLTFLRMWREGELEAIASEFPEFQQQRDDSNE